MKRVGLALLRAYIACGILAGLASSRRIAIIGAGPAGTAAAYFAQEELLSRGEQPAEIHVFERSDRVGGRAHAGTVVYGNRTLYFEQGASMFISKNRHLMEMAGRFNLTLCHHPCTYASEWDNSTQASDLLESSLKGYGIWNPDGLAVGGEWIVGPGGRWRVLDTIKLLWRYRGMGDLKHVRMRTKAAVDEFLQSYDAFSNHSSGIFGTWSEYLADKPILRSSLYYRAEEYYLSAREGIRRRFLEEVVSLATRVNYMQDIDTVNTLGAHISMAAESDTAYSVAGGNWQIFDRMLASSGAKLHLQTAAAEIAQSNATTGHYALYTRPADSGNINATLADTFDTIIIAAPLPLADISILDNKHRNLAAVNYVHMYVTFAIGILRKDLFPEGVIPRLIVTPYRTTKPFNCLSILACLGSGTPNNGRGCHEGPVLVKIFSHEPVSLEQIFLSTEWHHEQQWHSYPSLEPLNAGYVAHKPESAAFTPRRSEPPPIVLDIASHKSSSAGSSSAPGIFYVNGMESLFSTMESQTVAARHVVRLALFGSDAAMRASTPTSK
ncbi:hypothetical protein H4R20_005177 [Coemansia guatemalensis]|uniref:Prenylcysteine lyase domain-containing protein n=1 Tax=Coemansia guatemalensis TaxID=2761395 RepID=A0A9W8LPU1_9FUNG|nr:hypothetical protein H4R20_005177 [Coemansia guatemalensis]